MSVHQALLLRFLVTLALAVALIVAGAPLNTEAAPMGILSFEFCWTGARAAAMIDSWGGTNTVWAVQLLDTLFPFAYGSLGWGLAKRFDAPLAGRLWVAGAAMDMLVENVLLGLMLVLGPYSLLALGASLAASVKFLGLGAALALGVRRAVVGAEVA